MTTKIYCTASLCLTFFYSISSLGDYRSNYSAIAHDDQAGVQLALSIVTLPLVPLSLALAIESSGSYVAKAKAENGLQAIHDAYAGGGKKLRGILNIVRKVSPSVTMEQAAKIIIYANESRTLCAGGNLSDTNDMAEIILGAINFRN